MSVSALLTVFGFLHGRATAVSPCYVFLFLRFGLHLAGIGLLRSSFPEVDAVHQDIIKITHIAGFWD